MARERVVKREAVDGVERAKKRRSEWRVGVGERSLEGWLEASKEREGWEGREVSEGTRERSGRGKRTEKRTV